MSSEQEEERKEYVERDEPVTTVSQPVAVTPQGTQVRQPATVVQPAAPPVAVATASPGSERKESVVRRTNTNTGAIVAIVVGVVVLLLGIYLVFTRVFPYLSYPWSLFAVLLVAVVLMIVGGSLIQARTRP